jgi:hypothetical protein
MDVLDRRFRVRRRWLPWKRRIRRIPGSPGSGNASLGNDPVSGVIGLAVLVLAIPALIVGALLLVELFLLLLLVPVFAVVRLLLPVPWTVEVGWRPRGATFWGWIEEHEEQVAGWRASRARIAQLREAADGLGRGERFVPPDPPEGPITT